jgi:Flp pilus assembly protein TadG
MAARFPTAEPRERGSATLETVIVYPALLVLIYGAIQAGLWFHARDICLAAAQEGARAGAAYNGSSATARAAAEAFLAEAGRGLVTKTAVAVSRGVWVEVTVTAEGLSLVPGFPVTVSQAANLPVEVTT